MYCNFIIACKDNLRDSDSNNMATCITIELPLEALWLQCVSLISFNRNSLSLCITRVFRVSPAENFTVRTWITS